MHNSFYPALNLPNEVHTHRRQVRAFVSPPFICPEGKDHCPKSHEERKQIKEWLFLAAVQGCLPFVQHCLEETGLDSVQSDNSELTVMDWAQRGVDQAVDGAQEVVGYLVAASNTDLPIAEPVESSSSSLSRCEHWGQICSTPSRLSLNDVQRCHPQTLSHRLRHRCHPQTTFLSQLFLSLLAAFLTWFPSKAASISVRLTSQRRRVGKTISNIGFLVRLTIDVKTVSHFVLINMVSTLTWFRTTTRTPRKILPLTTMTWRWYSS